MISIEELYLSKDLGRIDHDTMLNLGQLHYRLNFIRKLWAQPMMITSGFRTPEEQMVIYQAKGLPPKMGSAHLDGAAADISDPDGKLKRWILDHLDVVEALNLYFEDFDYTKGWIHAQLWSPASGKRFFIP